MTMAGNIAVNLPTQRLFYPFFSPVYISIHCILFFQLFFTIKILISNGWAIQNGVYWGVIMHLYSHAISVALSFCFPLHYIAICIQVLTKVVNHLINAEDMKVQR